jgi:hypothetical protein
MLITMFPLHLQILLLFFFDSLAKDLSHLLIFVKEPIFGVTDYGFAFCSLLDLSLP